MGELLPGGPALVHSGLPSALWRVRVETARWRGSGLSQPGAGVMMCIIGERGGHLFKLEGHEPLPGTLLDDLGSLRSSARGVPECTGPSAGPRRPRFQAGDWDEIEVFGPDVGELRGLWVAPEAGEWGPEAITLSSSADPEGSARFESAPGLVLGARGEPVAVELLPGAPVAPPDPAAVAAARAAGLEEWQRLKSRALLGTGAATAAVAGGALVWGGQADAVAVSAGGAAGLVYLWLLEAGVDAVGVEGEGILARVAGSPVLRAALVAVAALAAAWGLAGGALSEGKGLPAEDARILLECAGGFLCYKLGVLLAGMSPQPTGTTQGTESS